MAVLREGEAEKTKRFACDVRKSEIFLKNYLRFNPICVKYTFFVTHITRH